MFYILLSLLLIILKLFNVITWSWIIVLSPIIFLCLVLSFIGCIVVFFIIDDVVDFIKMYINLTINR